MSVCKNALFSAIVVKSFAHKLYTVLLSQSRTLKYCYNKGT